LATEKLTVPAAVSLVTNKISVALEMLLLVVPAGNCVRSNCTSAWSFDPPPTFSVVAEP
jgi:hypothetical protein